MHKKLLLAFLSLQCTLCITIRVPVDWNDDSEVKEQFDQTEHIGEQAPIYNEYFKYAGKKPQFVVDIAAAHGVQSPENHYKSYPIKPYTDLNKPILGHHQIANFDNTGYQPFQQIFHNSGKYVSPAKTSYEIYHPYIAEKPALQAIYKDPVLDKIRNDIRNGKHRLEKYETDVGESNIKKDEYLESPEKIDRKKVPQNNIPVRYELHRPQRRPVYYRQPEKLHHIDQLNNRFRHPWNQNIKVTPNHYRPVKHHLQRLRQQHAIKYDDEQNEYPQLPHPERYEEKPEGYDIYEKGKEQYVKLRNNLDEAINKVTIQNRPQNQYIELQKEPAQDNSGKNFDEEQFVPIKNYAQVRKTETTKHLPRTAALLDAENYEEIQNAPRLREAIKSTKAQIVYSEEGYEDAAYDHAGEQKHASDHERHGGFLKENEISGGRYKEPSISSKFADAEGSAYRDQRLHGEKWKDDKKVNKDESETNNYSEDDEELDLSRDVIVDEINLDSDSDRNKRNSDLVFNNNITNCGGADTKKINSMCISKNQTQHDVIKRETKSIVPEFDFNSTLPSDNHIKKLSETKFNAKKIKKDKYKHKNKYPYYSKNIKTLNKNSPLRYAENIKLIPKKSSGGTEFYDSRSQYECPEVEDEVDPIPDKLKKDGHPDDYEDIHGNSTNGDKFKSLKNNQRLRGLGDKIDCFKAKYFGENPLDSPFFKEDIIENPEPVTKPSKAIFKNKESTKNWNDNDTYDLLETIGKIRDQVNKAPTKNNNKENATQTFRIKRATGFMYEPYKIIRDSQVQDSKKTTTTSNISPLIKQLQSSRVIDKVISNSSKKSTKIYKDIGKTDRQKLPNEQLTEPNGSSFINVSPDKRGEPRFELRPSNHKTNYTPVANKRAMSMEDYKLQMNISDIGNNAKLTDSPKVQQKRSSLPKTTSRPFFDVSKYLPQPIETQNLAASNTVQKVMRTTSDEATEKIPFRINVNSKEEYDEYEDDGEDEVEVITTTTQKAERKRTRGTTTTKPAIIENQSDPPKLRLTTRFRSSPQTEKTKVQHEVTEKPFEKEHNHERNTPKYSEKKRKSTKSTLVTDTKTYGDDEDDDTRKEVDALIHVKQDMDEYTPQYEKHGYGKSKNGHNYGINDEEKHDNDDNDDDDDDDDDHDDDDNDEDDVKIDNDEEVDDIGKNDDENVDKDHKVDVNNDDEDDDGDHEINSKISHKNLKKENDAENHSKHLRHKIRLKVTTSEPTKRTLVRTTIAPPTTTESRSAKIELKPTILKKKIEIHDESPLDRSSPHVTQFKQKIKEVEIIKEMLPKPKRKKNNHNTEALHLYRDENLAEEINKLGDVEIFRENLDLDSEPRHGGNYRSITPEELEREKANLRNSENKSDVDTSETETKKVELSDVVILKNQRGLDRPNSKISLTENTKSAKYTELSDSAEVLPRSMHGGNLKFSRNKGTRNTNKSEKLIEFDDDDEDETSSMHGGNFKSSGQRNTGRPMHGGNYRSAKIVQADETSERAPKRRGRTRDARTNAAALLDSYARAVPILTTTTPFILDPSKRMYYYVDA